MNITSTAYCQRWNFDIEEQALSLSAFHEILADTKSEKEQPTDITCGQLLPESPTNPAAVESLLDTACNVTRTLG